MLSGRDSDFCRMHGGRNLELSLGPGWLWGALNVRGREARCRVLDLVA